MKLTIRYNQAIGANRHSHEVTLESEKLTIGRGSDQSIQIPDRRFPLSHSTLAGHKDGLELVAEGGYSFLWNGQSVSRAVMRPGDVVDLFGHSLSFISSDEAGGCSIEIEIKENNLEPLQKRFVTRLSELEFPIRSVSWLLFLTIILGGLLVPSIGLFVPMKTLRDLPLVPDDHLWSSGDLHDTHAFFEDQCELCHVVPFTQARDEECLTCHLNVNHHFDTERNGKEYYLGESCQDCHREHNGPLAITRQDQGVCSTCHEDLEAVGYANSTLRRATDFMEDHPPFMVSMTEMKDDGSWVTKRSETWEEGLKESSNLTFPHDVHMNPDGINGESGVEIMECSDCHREETGGLGMQPITMENHCAGCHQLSFDVTAPDRVVPHGEPDELIELLQGFYAYQYLSGGDEFQSAPDMSGMQVRPVRRPGRQDISKMPGAHSQRDSADALVLAADAVADIQSRVDEAADNLFEKQTCNVCHEISRLDGDKRWQVKPVRLTSDWFPMAVFSHEAHQNMGCDGCHESSGSGSAEDIMMPDIGSCRACHGGENSEGRLRSTCIDCHDFHLADQKPMGVMLMIDEEGNLIDQFGEPVDEEGNPVDSTSGSNDKGQQE